MIASSGRRIAFGGGTKPANNDLGAANDDGAFVTDESDELAPEHLDAAICAVVASSILSLTENSAPPQETYDALCLELMAKNNSSPLSGENPLYISIYLSKPEPRKVET